MSMSDIDQEFLRKLTQWNSDGVPVSTLYLDVDGRRHPRRQDYVLRAEQLCHSLQREAERQGRDAQGSVSKDTGRMMEFLRSLERGQTRGLAMFSASGAGLWEQVLVPRPVRDRAVVSPRPYVLPLEAVLETYEAFCTVLVDREKARIFLARMGTIHERADVFDEVPGQHEQGGRSQARYSRHIEEMVARHLKHVADVLLRFFKRKGFDHLILAGPEEVLPEFEEGLHDYLRRRIVGRLALPMTASPREVLERSLATEETIEAARERTVAEKVQAEAAAGRHAVVGFRGVLDALNQGRVELLLAPIGLTGRGIECMRCGWLAAGTVDRSCPSCGGRMEPVSDIVESAVARALGQSSRVETLPLTAGDPGTAREQQIGALLRY
jgi:peptide chain release factor subunit 1